MAAFAEGDEVIVCHDEGSSAYFCAGAPDDFSGREFYAAEICSAFVSAVEAVEVAVFVDADGPVVLHGFFVFPDFLESVGGQLEGDCADFVGG